MDIYCILCNVICNVKCNLALDIMTCYYHSTLNTVIWFYLTLT